MDIAIHPLADVTVVALTGNLDTSSAPEADKALKACIAEGTTKLLVDLENIDFVSSAGLRVLLAAAKGLKATSGEIRICCLNKTVQEVFDISGFSAILSVFADRAAATDGF